MKKPVPPKKKVMDEKALIERYGKLKIKSPAKIVKKALATKPPKKKK